MKKDNDSISSDGSTESVDWSDMVPIDQDDGPNPIVSIAYSADFKRLMGIFRAVIFKGEKSPRALDLTEELLDLNAANYTVWQYRRECLATLKSDLNDELRYMEVFAEDNPKNYQIWFHRRAIVERLRDPSKELAFCEKVFLIDSKNYHAWAHRQWVIETFGLWEGELGFTDRLIQVDIRNNSAWNQRWFVVHNNPGDPPSKSTLDREVQFAMDAIAKVTNNESSWNYLRGLATFHPTLGGDIKTRMVDMVDKSGGCEGCDNPLALSLLADMWEKDKSFTSYEQAEALYQRLMVVDKVRVKSWMKRHASLGVLKQALFEQEQGQEQEEEQEQESIPGI